ncbi:caspase-10 isoform X2 [Onychostruthus taczanowskii]|uniref:caspase-10 isoform X2 n=1 Tax=Onychostruthus taczanowskii TaxID=356909 RepID=UPI001B8046D5|nr:caspase-10 isoform X2 [Onychostruthus taczanowskii]
MENDISLKFHQQLFLISENLVTEDVAALKFLCTDLLCLSKLEDVKSAADIFKLLMAQDYLNAEDTFLLAELLYRIRCHSLLEKLGYTKEKVQERLSEKGRISPYRQMLYELSENITSEMLKEIIFLLQSHLPKRWTILTVKSYKMDGPHRGFCLIINNVNFNSSQRKGSCKDAEQLERVFTWLGLDVRTCTNLTSREIINLMKTWQQVKDHKDRNCFICCILSHGRSGAICGTDDRFVSIRVLMSHFTAKQCPQLAAKPKLFFIQACQGDEVQRPVYVDTDGPTPDFSVQERVSLSESIPEEADFLLGMATVDGCVSFRHVAEGSWYIQALCSKLQLLVPRGEDILSILTQVNEDVARRDSPSGTKKQMPQPAYTLRRKFIFPIPTAPPPSEQHQSFQYT